jgi:hypothetical protein
LLRLFHRGHHRWAIMRPPPNAGPKSPPCRIESHHNWVGNGILLADRDKLVADGLFRETLESQRKDNTSLLHLVPSEDLKYCYIFARVSTFSFKDLLFQFLLLTVKVWLLEWHLMLELRKLADDSTVRCSWIHERPENRWEDREPRTIHWHYYSHWLHLILNRIRIIRHTRITKNVCLCQRTCLSSAVSTSACDICVITESLQNQENASGDVMVTIAYDTRPHSFGAIVVREYSLLESPIILNFFDVIWVHFRVFVKQSRPSRILIAIASPRYTLSDNISMVAPMFRHWFKMPWLGILFLLMGNPPLAREFFGASPEDFISHSINFALHASLQAPSKAVRPEWNWQKFVPIHSHP